MNNAFAIVMRVSVIKTETEQRHVSHGLRAHTVTLSQRESPYYSTSRMCTISHA